MKGRTAICLMASMVIVLCVTLAMASPSCCPGSKCAVSASQPVGGMLDFWKPKQPEATPIAPPAVTPAAPEAEACEAVDAAGARGPLGRAWRVATAPARLLWKGHQRRVERRHARRGG